MESINRMAIELADEALDFAEELGVGAVELENGATVLDFGVDAVGGLEAGLLLAELQTAGLATVQTRMDAVAGAPLPFVELSCDRPALAFLCSQKAGWELEVGEFEGLGSGPARALVAEEAEFRALGYTDAFDLTVLAVESGGLPDERVAAEVAERADVNPEGVFLAAYAAASIAGSVATAARAGELAAFRLFELGYDPTAIASVSATAPVAPVAGDEDAAIARTNDALAYGGRVSLTLEEDSDAFEDVPADADLLAGRPFAEVFADAGGPGNVDAGAFGPAQVTASVLGGPTRVHGEVDESVLAESFGL